MVEECLQLNDWMKAWFYDESEVDSLVNGKIVTVEKLSTAETGFLASYVVKQGGLKVGNTINIPKDFLVKSGSVKTVTVADKPVTGYVVGDKYIDLVINTKDSTGSDEHIYVLVSDLVDKPLDWSDIVNKPSAYVPVSHTHLWSEITDKPSSFTPVSHTHLWSEVTGKPSTFVPSSHSHGNINDDGTLDVDLPSQEHTYILMVDSDGVIVSAGLIPDGYILCHEALGFTNLDMSSYSDFNLTNVLLCIDNAVGGKANVGHTHSEYLTSHQDLTGYVQKSVTRGLLRNDGTVDTNTYLTTHQSLSGYLEESDVANNLTTTSSGKVLDARQGKVLADLIGDAITYINQ